MKLQLGKIISILSIVYVICLVIQASVTINHLTGKVSEGTVSLEIESRPTTTTETTTTGGGGASSGGGAGVAAPKKDFTLDQGLIKSVLKKGQLFEKGITLKNTGNTQLVFTIEHTLEEILEIKEDTFTLSPGEEKEIKLSFNIKKGVIPQVYVGKIYFYAKGVRKEIPLIIEVESKIVLFDMSLDIVADYRTIKPGKDLLAQITLFNLQNIGRTDVQMHYYIKDQEGNIIIESEEVIGIETQASFVKTFNIPEDLQDGDYILILQARYDSSIGTASELFKVTRREIEIPFIVTGVDPVTIVFLIIILIVISTVLYFITRYQHKKRRQKYKKQRKKIKKIKKEHKQKIKKIRKRQKKKVKKITKKVELERSKVILKTEKQKLIKQLHSIEKAYKLKFISEKSYMKSEKRLNRIIDNINKKLKK